MEVYPERSQDVLFGVAWRSIEQVRSIRESGIGFVNANIRIVSQEVKKRTKPALCSARIAGAILVEDNYIVSIIVSLKKNKE